MAKQAESNNLPIAALLQQATAASIGVRACALAASKLIGFVFVGWLLYGTPINNYEQNGADWSWGFVDCWWQSSRACALVVSHSRTLGML